MTRLAVMPRNVVLVGDAVAHLRQLPNGSVDCVVTSPPYFRLRNYGMPGQLGLEPTIDQWVDNLVAVMDEVARVLVPTGTVWLVVADSYSRSHRSGAPPKSLLLGPERLSLALVLGGWVIRNLVVWAKPNPMPASVSDRLTAGHERLLLLTRQRHYYFELHSIREPHRGTRRPTGTRPADNRPPSWAGPLAGNQRGLARMHARGQAGHRLGKNPGDVWTIPAGRAIGDHHAVFPEALVRRPILAGTPERVCLGCPVAWQRANADGVLSDLAPVCACDAAWRPGLVLDPFMGSGTVGVVAEQLGRDWLGIELNAGFAAAAEQRISAARHQADNSRTARDP